MNTHVKICGLTRPEDVEAALRYGADMLGFIVEAKSSRRLSVAEAARISRPAIGCAQRVAVTVNADEGLLGRIANQMQPDFLQLHGDESPKWVRKVKALTGLPIIKAVAIRDRTDLEQITAYEAYADYILLDAKAPKGESQRGGHGLSFDWGLLKNFTSKTPLILAGGLNPKNIIAAKHTGIKIFDVSSGVEAKPGVKDHEKIQAFMKAAKS
ncbi:MAG: phosphoribosylanthranilate isomerase [Robiginitomaculum sp.]|nr:phosphoribosylanthranilate isomerase [Robiginitomaculum sp.]